MACSKQFHSLVVLALHHQQPTLARQRVEGRKLFILAFLLACMHEAFFVALASTLIVTLPPCKLCKAVQRSHDTAGVLRLYGQVERLGKPLLGKLKVPVADGGDSAPL